MLSELSEGVNEFIEKSQIYMPGMLKLMAALWVFNYANWKTGSKLNRFGILPRTVRGLVGILLAPILHKNLNHLLFNSVPLFFLGIFAMSLNLIQFYWATLFIILLAGTGVWCIGRYGNHIGASALIAGYFGYVLAYAYLNPTFIAFFCAAVAFYYFGSILFSLFPSDAGTSWEGHLCGFIAGLLAMALCNHQQLLIEWANHFLALMPFLK